MANTNSEFDKELDQLRSDMADLRKDMSALVKTMKDAGISEGQHLYEEAAERAKHARDAARKRATDTYSALEKEVEERPLTSILTAFGTGFVMGIILDRRH